ncbi:40S ribosomal protein S8-like [Acanthaster planci]|uniref:40S ribosomal protein S8-like n=1 Tax=Acanthaster planci TaxID=133434 RepID=A0A8B7YFB7_ACAPL|nr:40S ribosomal protein S8-like [Acanthaster planci]
MKNTKGIFSSRTGMFAKNFYLCVDNLAPDVARKTRILDVVYNASNIELVRTKTLVKSAIVLVDSTPFRQWYEAHYALPLAHKGTCITSRPGQCGRADSYILEGKELDFYLRKIKSKKGK